MDYDDRIHLTLDYGREFPEFFQGLGKFVIWLRRGFVDYERMSAREQGAEFSDDLQCGASLLREVARRMPCASGAGSANFTSRRSFH